MIQEINKDRAPERSPCFIIPEPAEVVNDVVEVKAITNVSELGLIQPGVAVYFTELRLLKLVSEFIDLFPEVDFVVLMGYPESVYSEAFNQLVWPFEQLSFDSLLAELAAQKRIDAIRADQPKSRGDGSRVPREAKPKVFDSFDRMPGRNAGDVPSESADDEAE